MLSMKRNDAYIYRQGNQTCVAFAYLDFAVVVALNVCCIDRSNGLHDDRISGTPKGMAEAG